MGRIVWPIEEAGRSRPLRVFLCHTSSDKPAVRRIYETPLSFGVDPWLDEKKIKGGQDWDLEIRKAVRASDVVVVCLSGASTVREGYVQKEIRQALDVADEKPQGTIFIIPLRLEPCEAPERLRQWHWIDYFEESGIDRLFEALSARARHLNGGVERPPAEEYDDQPRRVTSFVLRHPWVHRAARKGGAGATGTAAE